MDKNKLPRLLCDEAEQFALAWGEVCLSVIYVLRLDYFLNWLADKLDAAQRRIRNE